MCYEIITWLLCELWCAMENYVIRTFALVSPMTINTFAFCIYLNILLTPKYPPIGVFFDILLAASVI